MKKRFMNNNTFATLPGNVKISHKKLKIMHPEHYGFIKLLRKVLGKKNNAFDDIFKRIEEHMYYGLAQPAVVVSTNPLYVACYAEDIDCVAILNFDEKFVDMYNLKVKSRLLSVNTYGTVYHDDLIPGPKRQSLWTAFHPIVSEFISDDTKTIEERKSRFSEAEWDHVYRLGREHLFRMPNGIRDGRPNKSGISLVSHIKV